MNTIKRDVYVLRNTIKIPIEVTKGTDAISFEFTVRDYNLPATAAAVAYAYRGGMKKPNSTLCNVEDNVISFQPSANFFEVGNNELQIRVINEDKSLISFKEKVKCSDSIGFPDDEEEKQQTLVEQLVSYSGKETGERKAADEAEKQERIAGDAQEKVERQAEIATERARINQFTKLAAGSTTGDAELIDGRTDVDGNVHDNIGDAMRGQTRKLRENLVVRQKEQPTDPNNNVWISDEDDEVEVPDIGEFNSLKEDLVTYNEQEKYNMKTIPYNKNIMKMKQQSFSINGVEFIAKDNTIKLNGTATKNTPIQLTIPVDFEESSYYTITFWNSKGTASGGSIIIYTIFENGTYKTFTDALDKRAISYIESTKGTVYFRLYFTAGTTFDNYETQLMISKTNVYPTEFEYYSEIPKYTPYVNKQELEEFKKSETSIKAGIGVFTKFATVGDSLSVGYHVESNNQAVQRDYNHSWGKYVEKLYGAKCYWTGKAGETSKTWLEQTSGNGGLKYTQDLGEMPLYIVTMGANESGFASGTIDDINSDTPSTLYGYVGKLFRELRSISPKCYIIALGVSRKQDNANIINSIYKNVCDKFDKAYYYNIQPMLESKEFMDWFYGGHYSAVGYMKMGVFYNKVVGDIIDNNTHDFLYVDESDVLQ